MKIFVETSWLNENLYKSNIKIIDSSWYLPNEKRNCYNEYLKEHIPGSLFIDIDNISDEKSKLPHMLPNYEKFETDFQHIFNKLIEYNYGHPRK